MLSETRPSHAQLRAEIARAARHVRANPDDAAAIAHLDQIRSEYRARVLEDQIRQTVDTAPPLTIEQRSRLAVLLRPGAAA